VTANFVYDGDGRRVKGTVNGVTTVIVGDHYEVRTDGEGSVAREHYFAGSSPIAVRELPSGKLSWLLTDHLGSISAVADAGGSLTAEVRYRAFGDVRYAAGISPTNYQYTGQRAEPLIGLDDYRARGAREVRASGHDRAGGAESDGVGSVCLRIRQSCQVLGSDRAQLRVWNRRRGIVRWVWAFVASGDSAGSSRRTRQRMECHRNPRLSSLRAG
jgi:hypothetical protein